MERSEERLGNNTTDMSGISMMADKADRVRKDLERETMAREDQIEQLENKLKVIFQIYHNHSSIINYFQEAKYLAVDAERKYEEVARKMNMMENDLEKAMNRAEGCEDKIVDREHELKVIGDNMKAMEVTKKQLRRQKMLIDRISYAILARLARRRPIRGKTS